MIGYPDESVEEGLDHALSSPWFHFPDRSCSRPRSGTGISTRINPDEMRWTKSIMKNLKTDPTALEHIRQLAWRLVNRSDYARYKRTMAMPDIPIELDRAAG